MAATGPGTGLRPALLSIIETVMVSRTTDQLGLNIRHHQVTQIVGQGFTLGQWVTLMAGVIAPLYKNVIAPQATYVGTLARLVGIGPVSASAWDTAGTGIGLGTGDMMPKQTAGLIAYTTAFAGRGSRGRTYVPFPTEGMNDPTGVPAATYRTAVDSIAQMWMGIRTIGGPDGGTGTPVLFHKRTGGATLLLAYQVSSRWATQRRRGDYGRTNPASGGPIPAGAWTTSEELRARGG